LTKERPKLKKGAGRLEAAWGKNDMGKCGDGVSGKQKKPYTVPRVDVEEKP